MAERTEILKRFPDGEDRILAAHLLDLAERSRRRNVLTCSRFLNPSEQGTAFRLLEYCGFPRHIMTGGYDDAERQVLIFLPDYLEENLSPEELPIGALHAGWGKENSASHRDVLGSLMALGVERDTVGDILVAENGCDVVLMKDVLPFLRENWDSIGRFHIHPEEKPLDELLIPVEDETVLQDTVAGLRLDAVVGCGFSLARGKASELVRSGRVFKNGRPAAKPDTQLEEGDTVTARGFGKIVLETVGPRSKKGRIRITIRKYG